MFNGSRRMPAIWKSRMHMKRVAMYLEAPGIMAFCLELHNSKVAAKKIGATKHLEFRRLLKMGVAQGV